MNKEIKNILKEASEVLDRIENGKVYPSSYVVNRFVAAAEKHPTDQLVNNMRDVIMKVASKQEFISQTEIGGLYNKMYGFSGGHTGFRDSLEDLLPQNLHFEKVAYPTAKNRTMEENSVKPLYKDSELSNAFSVLFSLGANNSFSTFVPGQDKNIQKSVFNALSKLGHVPEGVDILHSNEHFALCSANYKTTNFNKASALIPVQITNGYTRDPELVILGGQPVSLDRENLYTAIKESEKDLNTRSRNKFAGERGDNSPELKMAKVKFPNELKDEKSLENKLLAAAAKFDQNHINMAIATLSSELSSHGFKNSEIKLASADKRGLIFSANIPTKAGMAQIKVPVEIVNGIVTLPSRFASEVSNNKETVFDFSREGFERFANSVTPSSRNVKIARDAGPLSDMSYFELVDQMVEGVANKDYKLAEDVLDTIQVKFGGNQYAIALDQFTQLLKHSSTISTRSQLIKAAYDRGELIKIPTSVELYCPTLGLPISKVAFDSKGKPIPATRSKSENQLQDLMISSTRVVLT